MPRMGGCMWRILVRRRDCASSTPRSTISVPVPNDPADFGAFSDALLVSNFGDGTIVAFDRTTHTAIDYLRDPYGNPISIAGIWGLQFGNGASLGEANHLYFAAGPADETDGLFGKLQVTAPVPEPATWLLVLAGCGLLGLRRYCQR